MRLLGWIGLLLAASALEKSRAQEAEDDRRQATDERVREHNRTMDRAAESARAFEEANRAQARELNERAAKITAPRRP